jgi:hypothetical protein
MMRSVLLLAGLCGVVAGCSLVGGSGAATGTVSGVVLIGGGTVYPPGGSDVYRVKGAFVLVSGMSASGAKVERHLVCDSRGHFRVRLSPGRYTFVAQIFPANPTHPRRSVVVERGQSASIVLKGHVI